MPKGKPSAYAENWIPDSVDLNAPLRKPIVDFCKMVTSRIPYHLGLKKIGKEDPEYWAMAAILTDEEARTTLDNALNAYRLLQERDLHEVILVTSTYHLKWAHAIFGAAAELFRQESGYRIHVADNYCFQIENNGRYQTDTMTIAQLRELVNQITPPPEENENR